MTAMANLRRTDKQGRDTFTGVSSFDSVAVILSRRRPNQAPCSSEQRNSHSKNRRGANDAISAPDEATLLYHTIFYYSILYPTTFYYIIPYYEA